MKFVFAINATFEPYFLGKKTLVFPDGTSEQAIRLHIEKLYSGGNWQRSSLVLERVKVKEKGFQATCAKLA